MEKLEQSTEVITLWTEELTSLNLERKSERLESKTDLLTIFERIKETLEPTEETWEKVAILEEIKPTEEESNYLSVQVLVWT